MRMNEKLEVRMKREMIKTTVVCLLLWTVIFTGSPLAAAQPTCEAIRAVVADLEDQVRSWGEELLSAPTSAKPAITRIIRDLQAEITRLKGENPDCFAPIPRPVLKIFGQEVNQGLQGYPLVAGKDTLVRVFVGVEPPLDVAPLIIDRAVLQIKRNGVILSPPIEAVIPNPTFANTVQQFSEDTNVNFYLDGSNLPAGNYEFKARLFHGTTLLKEIDFGKTYTFDATRDLRLLIAFEKDPFKDPDDLSKDPVLGPYIRDEILPTLSRLYPIRKGVGLIDTSKDGSGDKTSGLRYFIYKDFIDVPRKAGETDDEFEARLIAAEISALDRFNLDQRIRGPRVCEYFPDLMKYLCTPGGSVTIFDQADNIVHMGRSAPADFVMGVEGGRAAKNGKWSRVHIALNPGPIPSAGTVGAGSAGKILAEEVGHNFGLVNPSQPNSDGDSHSKNFYIQDMSAFNLKRKVSIAPSKLSDPIKNPLDYLCKKPSVPPPPGILLSGPTSVMSSINNNECVLLEVPDWNWVMNKLKPFSPIIAPSEQPVFYIVGTINRNNVFEKLDSRLLPPNSPTDPPVDSPFMIVFLNENGQVLTSTGFDVSFEATHGLQLTSTAFSVAQPFPLGTTEVQLRNNSTVIASLKPSINPPNVTLLTPRVGEIFTQDKPGMLIQWNGSDRDGDPLTYTLSFSSDGGETFLPIGTVFSSNTTSYVWDTSFAPNTQKGLIRIEASDGFNVATASSELFAVHAGRIIHGTKFNDANGNKIRDAGEEGLANWTIRLKGFDTLNRTIVDKTIVTDINGNYSFTDLTPGFYTVFEEKLPSRWVPTTPPARSVRLTADAGEMVVDFGNRRI